VIGGLPDIVAKRADLAPGSVAMEELATGRTLTYAQLNDRVARASALLLSRGVRAGDRVAILCRNRIAFFELLFACARTGAILVPLNWRMPPAELAGLIADSAPVLVFHGAKDAQAAAGSGLPAIGLDEDYEALIAAAEPVAALRHEWPADGIWYLLYTSGTTGRPKGVIYTFRMALANYVNIGAAIGLNAGDTSLNFLPLFHTAGINLHTLPTLIEGGRVLVAPCSGRGGSTASSAFPPSIRPCSTIRASPPPRSATSVTGAAAAPPCPKRWPSGRVGPGFASAPAWA
jgi:fatty-acyl-CoA synthase